MLDPRRGRAEPWTRTRSGSGAILGSTFTGEFEPVEAISAALDRVQAQRGWEIPIHVDAASGGFVAPFLHPALRWDFRLARVASINVSGHKYGLVYPGIGWVLWRDKAALPEELIFHVNYLGGDLPTFTLNFSRPASPRSSRSTTTSCASAARGTTRIMENLQSVGEFPRREDRGDRRLHRARQPRRPAAGAVHRARRTPASRSSQLSDKLREFGWFLPAYTMPAKIEDIAVLRIVVREGFSQRHGDRAARRRGARGGSLLASQGSTSPSVMVARSGTETGRWAGSQSQLSRRQGRLGGRESEAQDRRRRRFLRSRLERHRLCRLCAVAGTIALSAP